MEGTLVRGHLYQKKEKKKKSLHPMKKPPGRGGRFLRGGTHHWELERGKEKHPFGSPEGLSRRRKRPSG